MGRGCGDAYEERPDLPRAELGDIYGPPSPYADDRVSFDGFRFLADSLHGLKIRYGAKLQLGL